VIGIGAVVAGIAALVHVLIFYLESVAWTSDRARAVFGTTRDEAESTRELALNQGFYNLFLSIQTVVGLAFLCAGATGVGAALALAGAGSMLAAATVLAVTSPDKRGAAVKQGALPLVAVVLLVVGLAI
jgi:putative membrane protein